MFTARLTELGYDHIRPIPIGFESPEIYPRGGGAIAFVGGCLIPILKEESGPLSYSPAFFSVLLLEPARGFRMNI